MNVGKTAGTVLSAYVLASCGGGHSSSSSANAYTPGVYRAESTFANQCAAPRSGSDPITGETYPDRAGSVLTENNFLRSWTHDLYLWYANVPDQNPADFSTALGYFDVLKTTAVTATGNPTDKFHFTYPTEEWEALSQNGTQVSYGAYFVLAAPAPPRQILVGYTESGSPAENGETPALARGTEILAVDGVDAVSSNDVNTLNAGLFPSTANESHTFLVRDHGDSGTRTVTLSAANVTSQPVQNVHAILTPTGSVGYMLFNDHLATSEAALVDAFNTLSGVSDLVLDIRYNGGGFLDIASEVAYMIAGNGPTAGRTFELTQFNDRHPSTNPVTGESIAPSGFHSTTQGFSTSPNQPLPTLNLTRVFILTTADTCSASESIINGLEGVDVQVILIGTTTCGKPYGFYPQDNCGTTYFSIQFRGVNAKNFGDYSDGFSPANTVSERGAPLPGCSVADDFDHPLGDSSEALFAQALAYRGNPGACPAPAAILPGRGVSSAARFGLKRPAARTSRIDAQRI